MSERFFEHPILNSPYEYPTRHWKLDEDGQPTGQIIASRRDARFISPVPAPTKTRGRPGRLGLGDQRLSSAEQEYNPYQVINAIRREVDRWRRLPRAKWGVTPETERLLIHWRDHDFQNRRPFFCQVEAVETAIWLVEVLGALRESKPRVRTELLQIWNHLRSANQAANPDLFRLALKMATGSGKTTVMAMLIAWQTVNAVRHPQRHKFTNGFLVVAPGITIRDRLRVLQPNDPASPYSRHELVPRDMRPDVDKALVVITNYHAFIRRERRKLSKGNRALLKGRGELPPTVETEGEMLRRVMPELMNRKRILVLNDEGHHCYREKPGDSDERKLESDEKAHAKKDTEAARCWISGLETVRRKIEVPAVFDLSATPFFLRGSGYAEGTLFPWTVSDFALMDAIECGIVKVPRVPVSDNVVSRDDMPRLRELWEHIGKVMPQPRMRIATREKLLDPQRLPALLETAINALYSHYQRTFDEWREAKIERPPVFIVVASNTLSSKLLYDFLSGYRRPGEDGKPGPWQGGLGLFRNFDESGNRLARPRTLLIDSVQLESGDALDTNFREAAKDEIERFRREITQRSGGRVEASQITDAELLREAMNTVGKPDALGSGIRCVVSVSMLTEGWDANTVTHILGVRAFGTQLLCEQVVGRALRRQSYDLNPNTGRFDPEYADVLGIPFDFTSKPAPVPPQKPRNVVHVHAVTPGRNDLEIVFPAVAGYRTELPDDRLTARFTSDSVLVLDQKNVGPATTTNQGIVGLPQDLRPDRNHDIRTQTLAFHLTGDLLRRHLRGADEEPRLHLFGQVKRIVTDWIEGGFLRCEGGTHRGQALYEEIAEDACERIKSAISLGLAGKKRTLAVLEPYNDTGSTTGVNFTTTRPVWKTASDRCHVNYAVCDSSWESAFCRVLEDESAVECYVKNDGLGFEVPYRFKGESHRYRPDFIVRVRDAAGEAIHIVVEIKGQPDEQTKTKADTMRSRWIPGVNNLGTFGRWEFVELKDVKTLAADFGRFLDRKDIPRLQPRPLPTAAPDSSPLAGAPDSSPAIPEAPNA